MAGTVPTMVACTGKSANVSAVTHPTTLITTQRRRTGGWQATHAGSTPAHLSRLRTYMRKRAQHGRCMVFACCLCAVCGLWWVTYLVSCPGSRRHPRGPHSPELFCWKDLQNRHNTWDNDRARAGGHWLGHDFSGSPSSESHVPRRFQHMTQGNTCSHVVDLTYPYLASEKPVHVHLLQATLLDHVVQKEEAQRVDLNGLHQSENSGTRCTTTKQVKHVDFRSTIFTCKASCQMEPYMDRRRWMLGSDSRELYIRFVK